MGLAAVAGATVVSGYMSSEAASEGADQMSNATRSAAELQKQTADEQVALQKQQYADQVARQAPWLQASQTALQRLQRGLTPGGEFSANFQFNNQDPSYQFRLQQGQRAMDASAASTGNMFTGGQLKALQSYGQDQASQEYQNAYNRYMNTLGFNTNSISNLAGVGQTVNSQLGGAGQNMAGNINSIASNAANNIGSLGIGSANAQAAAGMNAANQFGQVAGNLAGLYNASQMYGNSNLAGSGLSAQSPSYVNNSGNGLSYTPATSGYSLFGG